MRGPSTLRTMTAVILLLAATRVSATATDRPDLLALLDGYRSLRLAPKGIAIEGRTARVGHMEFTFEKGTLIPLQEAGGRTLGLFFQGKGRYSYRSEDSADRQVIEANLAHLTKAPLIFNSTVRDSFDRLVLFFAAPAFEDLWRAAAPAVDPAAQDAFGKIWKRIGQTYLEYDHLAAEAFLNGGDRQYIYAELEGGRETVGYSFDRTREFEERLFMFRSVQGVDLRIQETFSTQPVEGGLSPRTASLVLKHADLSVTTVDNHHATITSDLTLEAVRDGLRAVRLVLMNNRDPLHYNWASPKNALTIRRLTDESGSDLPHSHRYNEVLIQLPEPCIAGQTVKLHVESEGDVLSGLFSERYNNYFDLMGVAWYPLPERLHGRGHTFSLKVVTRKPFVPVASGRTVSLKDTGDSYELETRSERPARQAVVFAGKYVTREETVGDRTIRAHAYAAALQDRLDKIPRVARGFLDYFERTLGPYPFGDLDIVEAPDYVLGLNSFISFGLGPPGVVVITSEAYNPKRDMMTRWASLGINGRLAHEIAHQWFPHRAMPASSKDEWLSESLAEYLSALALGAPQSGGEKVMGFPEMLSAWRINSRSCKDAGPIEASAMLSGPKAWADRECLLYDRGPLVLHMLRALAGQEGFSAVLRRLIEKGDRGPVSTDDFRIAAEEVLKTDLRWFFEDWYGKGGIPEVKIRYDLKESGGRIRLAGRAEQVDGPRFRRILVPLLLEYGDDRREVRLVFQDAAVKDFEFELKERPRKISVDPFQNNLAVYN
jgi:peptidase M1-like protein